MVNAWQTWVNTTAETIPEELKGPFVDYNTTLPSSAPVERLFSLGKRVMNSTRTGLSDKSFEAMTLLAFPK